jgi:hypothetical protein
MSTYTYSRRRKTIPANLTLERPTAALDAKSIIALEWIALWAGSYGSATPSPATTIRRALQFLAQHLGQLVDPGHIRAELLRFEEAGKGHGTARTLTEARARIEAHLECPGAQPMDSWRDALHSQEHREESRRMLEAVEARMGALRPARGQR